MYKIIFFLLVIASQITFGQNELNFDFDYARFKYDSTSVFLEFYYNLNSKNMIVTDNQSGKISEAIVHIEMKNSAVDSFYINRDWKIQNVFVEGDSSGEIKNLSGVFGFSIPKGNYTLFVKAWDVNNSNFSKTIKENIEITPFDDKFSISDIELANNIKSSGTDINSIFYKNTFEVIPNSSMLFSAQNPAAFYYAELYNIIDEDSTAVFSLQKLLFNSAGVNVYKNVKSVKQIPTSLVEVGVINLSKYPTDSYSLVLSLINNNTKKAFLSTKRFFLYNPGIVDTTINRNMNASILGSTFAIMTDEECDRMFAESKYLATQREIDAYKMIDSLNAKREYLAKFWKNRDSDISTTKNEFQISYMKRVEYANEHFNYANKEGYLSDRGRVYLIYGEPDQKDFYAYESNMKPYEVWFYNNIEGGVTFAFGDLNGFGQYELLHSTKRGEIRDDNWMSRIKTQ